MTEATGTSKAAEAHNFRWDPNCIPPFPAIALRALHMMAGSDTSLIELCDLIRADVAFSAEILRIANSPLVAFSKHVTSVLQASMLLGFQRLRSITITVALKAYVSDAYTPLLKSCWRHSVACAIIAERSARSRFQDHDFAYTAGVLHDIGRVALAAIMPERYAHAAQRAGCPNDLLKIEGELCGIDHCQAGRSLVKAWSLPEAFLEITACHHEPQPHPAGVPSLIPPSCALADALGFAAVRHRSPRGYSEILADFPDPLRNRFPDSAKDLVSEIETALKVLESE
jgi:HD-like signal output (HDOD) protein